MRKRDAYVGNNPINNTDPTGHAIYYVNLYIDGVFSQIVDLYSPPGTTYFHNTSVAVRPYYEARGYTVGWQNGAVWVSSPPPPPSDGGGSGGSTPPPPPEPTPEERRDEFNSSAGAVPGSVTAAKSPSETTFGVRLLDMKSLEQGYWGGNTRSAAWKWPWKPKGAWESKNEWSRYWVEEYQKWVSGRIEQYISEGRKFQCKDLALTLIIEFASKNYLPVEFRYWVPADRTTGKRGYWSWIKNNDPQYEHMNDLLKDAMSKMNVWTLIDNTKEIYPSQAGAGDLILYKNPKPTRGNTGHTRVITKIEKKYNEKVRERRWWVEYAAGDFPSSTPQKGNGWLTGDLNKLGNDLYQGIRRWHFMF